ncbi:hypothetical protein JG687_00006643 [Phytophthora cactorum]|uniref:Uncharacterized protein n=1 Tax=Phytophthora cactorum TaxID=29920 RepID=A0A8T1UMA3_9STRA|nr:hypothetical protein JG687_00006643 [Phytophthora cactorum]
MLEMLFFSWLRERGATLVNKNTEVVDVWGPCSHVQMGDGVPTYLPDEAIWIKPRLWGQGSYDAIMVSKGEHCVRLVQVTSAKDHGFKVDYCYDWMKEGT